MTTSCLRDLPRLEGCDRSRAAEVLQAFIFFSCMPMLASFAANLARSLSLSKL